MNRKYELTDEAIIVNGHNLYRIRALKDFSNIKKGDLGGFIELDGDLCHEGNCWVGESAKVYDGGYIDHHARIFGNAIIYDSAWIFEYAKIYGNSRVSGHAAISGKVRICGNAWVCNYSRVYGHTMLSKGIWNKMMPIKRTWYIFSTTLQKIPVGKNINV